MFIQLIKTIQCIDKILYHHCLDYCISLSVILLQLLMLANRVTAVSEQSVLTSTFFLNNSTTLYCTINLEGPQIFNQIQSLVFLVTPSNNFNFVLISRVFLRKVTRSKRNGRKKVEGRARLRSVDNIGVEASRRCCFVCVTCFPQRKVFLIVTSSQMGFPAEGIFCTGVYNIPLFLSVWNQSAKARRPSRRPAQTVYFDTKAVILVTPIFVNDDFKAGRVLAGVRKATPFCTFCVERIVSLSFDDLICEYFVFIFVVTPERRRVPDCTII